MNTQTQRILVLQQKPYGEILPDLSPDKTGYIFLPFAHGARSEPIQDEYQNYITLTPDGISMECEGIRQFHQDHGYTFKTSPVKIQEMFDTTVRATSNIGSTIAVEKRSYYGKDAEKGSVYILEVLDTPEFKELELETSDRSFKGLCSKVRIIGEGYIGRTRRGIRGHLLQSAQMRNVEY